MTFPQPSPTIAKTQVVMDMITGLGWNVTQENTSGDTPGFPLEAGPEVLTAPDRLVTITPTPGPGWVTEEAALDCWGFQAHVRGASDDQQGAELAAQQLDVLILNGPYPRTVDGVVIALVTRAGATPAPMPLDTQDRRFSYVCTYLITTGLE